MVEALLIAYFLALGTLAVFGVHRLVLTRAARRAARRGAPRTESSSPTHWPKVVVQLPLYNEAFVAERLLERAAALRYPGPLELQVLDDSTDVTRQVVRRTAERLAARGVDITLVHREDRAGFKAGALALGLGQTDAELVAIFDADFLPPPDFLERIVPVLLASPDLGMVQARWGHDNRDASWLTRAQAIYLDAHFGIEHQARAELGHCFNFNGTAGIWRRRAIEEAGGWSHDTITEDLDLSYRAQLAGWRFEYVDDLVVPAELPESWPAFRAQQARWVRGSVETCRKLLPRLLRARGWSRRRRLEAIVHVSSNFAYVLMAWIGLLLPAAVVIRDRVGWRIPGGQVLLSALDVSMLTAGTFAMVIFYLASMRLAPGRARPHRGLELAFALCLGAGMSLGNAREALRGLFRRDSEFIRTPKKGDLVTSRTSPAYRAPAGLGLALFELAFSVYFFIGMVYAVRWALWGSLPFLTLYFVGFSVVGSGVARELLSRGSQQATAELPASALPPQSGAV